MTKVSKSIFMMFSMLTACALSPQIIEISPKLTYESSTGVQQNNAISITVDDSRASDQLGSRGGVYSDTALLTTKPNMTDNIRAALAGAFESIGYPVSSSMSPVTLNVSISELSYNNVKKTAANSIVVRAVINVECRNRQSTMDNEYTITDSKDFIKLPSDKTNATMVNSTLSTSLNRIFQDKNIFSCLNNQ